MVRRHESNAMTVSHPAESLLLDYVAGAIELPSDIDEHLGFCIECRSVVQRLEEGGLNDPAAFDDLDDLPFSAEPPAVPDAVTMGLAGAGTPEIAPHQLWRAAPPGRDERLLVWIRRVHTDGRPAVVPVTFDSDFADEYDLVVPAERSPLGIELVFNTTAEGSIDRRTLIDCVADVDVAADIDMVRQSRRDGRSVEGLLVGSPINSLSDERLEYRQNLTGLIVEMGTARFEPDRSSADESHDGLSEPDLQDDVLDSLFDDAPLAALVREVRNGLAYSYPRCRVLPLSWPDFGGVFRPVATLLNIDVFVRLVFLDEDIDLARLVEASRGVFDGDLALRAVCFSSTSAPFVSTLIDRQAVVESYETPSGNLRPNVEDILTGALAEVLTKYFDRVVDPFRVVVSAAMDEITVDPRALAVTAGGAAVDSVVSKATGYKIPGKSPGYQLVAGRRELVISIIEQALQPDGVDVRSTLGDAE